MGHEIHIHALHREMMDGTLNRLELNIRSIRSLDQKRGVPHIPKQPGLQTQNHHHKKKNNNRL